MKYVFEPLVARTLLFVSGCVSLTLPACGGDPGSSSPTYTSSTGEGSTTTGSTTTGTDGATTETSTTASTAVGTSTTGVGGATGTSNGTATTGSLGPTGTTSGTVGTSGMTSTTGTGGAPSTTTAAGSTTTSTDGTATTTGAGGTTTTVECTGETPPAAPSEIQATLDRTWQEMTGELQGMQGARSGNANIENRDDMAIDQVMAAGGTLSFCVRWGSSSATVSPELRDAIEETLNRGVNEWFKQLVGYDCYPYLEVDVSVTGWATTSRDLLQWEDGMVPIYVTQGDGDGLPACPNECSSLRQGLDSQFPSCAGGYVNHYDQMLSLQDGLGNTGFGEHDGQWVDLDGFVNSTNGGLYHIWLHEFGHGIGFPDYYDWESWGNGEEPPNSVMVAGRAIVVTEWDTWMMRRVWSELKSRWDL